jgi:hypothetical protein
LEKAFYALEHLKKSVLARADIFGCLRAVSITINRTKVKRIHTERMTAIPAKIAFAGENTCKISMKTDLGHFNITGHTRLTPSPRVSDKV